MVANLPLAFRHVALITHNQFARFLGLGLVELFHPVLQTLESLSVIDRIHKHHAGRPLIIRFSDSLKPLLTSGIPNLHFDLDIVDVDGFDFEINPNGGDVGDFVLFVSVAEEDIGFADCRVTDDDNLDKVVVLLLLATFGHL